MHSQARLVNPLYAEFDPEQRGEQPAESRGVGQARVPAKLPEQNILQVVLQILQSVLGTTVDKDQPLTEVASQSQIASCAMSLQQGIALYVVLHHNLLGDKPKLSRKNLFLKHGFNVLQGDRWAVSK